MKEKQGVETELRASPVPMKKITGDEADGKSPAAQL